MDAGKLLELLAEVRLWMNDHYCDDSEGTCLCNRVDMQDRMDSFIKEAEDDWDGSGCFQCGCECCEAGIEDYKSTMKAIRAKRGNR